MIIATGQDKCYDTSGREIPCPGTGQDGEFRVGASLAQRFRVEGELVHDLLSGLIWPKNANPLEFPLPWEEALKKVKELNRGGFLGFSDWRLPNRRELRSLVFLQAKNPVLPPDHPFENVFHGWYWTSTTAAINPRYAWNIHFGGGRMFYSHKEDERLVWPVRGENRKLFATGQTACFDAKGRLIPCSGTGQDGELRTGIPWPSPRFEVKGEAVLDCLTGLYWTRRADLAGGLTTWEEAFEVVRELNRQRFAGFSDWRLPNINELESLVDASTHSPALLRDHPFLEVREFYWSSTTSFYDPLWAWALYLAKGAVGIGLKHGRHFYVWAVRGNL
ncbi:DUF1566 domain-containing protein [Thermosulfurimonas dismutans]|uniref:Lcl C-terminal domain-containing protein n=1 Tax=Thermosulfurimonas dismutans TaxID=999894 RepID=A0A179D4Z9_9BACT|nr:DUF1566 domain-containing protein [Thermosulfurimonas dismutans]OAQ20861.1 hypothetical protein TDIS_0987 [Thermosulfurimonas dismutans]